MSISFRRQARVIAFQTIYSRHKLGVVSSGEERMISDSNLPEKYATFSRNLIQNTWQQLEEIDQVIEANLQNWKQKRLADTLNALLRIAICELKYFPDTDAKVVINEAIEICREYIDEKATKICNGVLHSASKDLRLEPNEENKG